MRCAPRKVVELIGAKQQILFDRLFARENKGAQDMLCKPILVFDRSGSIGEWIAMRDKIAERARNSDLPADPHMFPSIPEPVFYALPSIALTARSPQRQPSLPLHLHA